MDPSAWDFGTADLSLEEEAAYLRIVNAIHKHEAPVPDNDRVIAGLFRTSTRKARTLVQALVKAGKLTIEDGKIWNERARSDLVQRGFVSISRSESGAKGGRTRAENAAKALKENDQGQAIASSREEKRREDIPPKSPKGDLVREILLAVLSPETADAFIAHRKAKRAKMTEAAAKLTAERLAGHPDPDAVARLSIQNGWTGVFPENVKAQPPPPSDARIAKWKKIAGDAA